MSLPGRVEIVVAALAILGVLPGCSGGASRAAPGDDAGATEPPAEAGSPTPDAGAPEAAVPYPATTPDPPVVVSSGGPLLATPRIVPVFFPGETQAATLTDAITKYTSSMEWRDAVGEYGIGAATVAPEVDVPTSLPSTLTCDDLGNWLGEQLYDGTSTVNWGPVDATTIGSTVFVVFPPPSSTVYAPGYDGSPSDPTLCGRPYGLSGWHWQTTPAPGPTAPVVFAVVGRCTDGSVSLQDRMTATLSHELVEAATDPNPITAPAYSTVDDAHAFVMELTLGGEVADLCGQDGSQLITPPDVGHAVQRTWSNAAALAGHDPCVPAPSAPYFNVDADMPDTFYDPYVQVKVGGVAIPSGTSRTIELHLRSDAPTDPWTVTAVDPNAAAGGSTLLNLTLDQPTGQNGDVRHLTIQPTFTGNGTTALYEIDSTLGGTTHHWFGEVVVQ